MSVSGEQEPVIARRVPHHLAPPSRHRTSPIHDPEVNSTTFCGNARPETLLKPLLALFSSVIGSQWGNRAMLIRHVEDYLGQHSTPAHEPLGREQCDHLAAAVAELIPDWSVELHLDVLREPMIVILAENFDDDIGPTLVVYRDETTFHLEELCWDSYRKLGDYPAWADLVRAVRIRLNWEMPFPTTLH